MKMNLIWISFDLGVRGDYEGIYTLLDKFGAKECGDSTAVLNFEFKKDLLAELKVEMEEYVTLDRRSRVYVVFPGEKGKYKGKFLVGRRKPAAWAGYGGGESEEEDDIE